MSAVLSFPFRLAPNGTVATVEQGTEVYYGEQIQVLIGTNMGERPLVPTFGMPMMEFADFGVLALTQACSMYLPEVEISDVAVMHLSDERENVTVQFEITGA